MNRRSMMITLLLLSGFGSNGFAQEPTASCRVTAEPTRRVELSDGRVVSTDVKSVAASGGLVMAVGQMAYVFSKGATPTTSPVLQDSIAGFLIDASGAASLVSNPPGVRRLFFPRVAAAPGGAFHILYATGDDSLDKVSLSGNSASLWHARYENGAWGMPEHVASVTSAQLDPVNVSELLENAGTLTFLFPFTDAPYRLGGGIVLLRRSRGRWTSDTLRTDEAPASVSAIYATPGSLTVVFTMSGRDHTEVLFESEFRTAWTAPKRIAGNGSQPVTRPLLVRSGNSIVASWISWTWGSAESSRLEWMRLNGKGPVRPVAFGESAHPFEMISLNNRLPVWIIRGTRYGSTLSALVGLDTTAMRLPTLAIPFENPKASAVNVGLDRVMVLTMKQGRAPDEPMVASFATVLEFRCNGVTQRE